jgi:hypothetical protein
LLGEAIAAIDDDRPLIAYLEDTPLARARLRGVESVLGPIGDLRVGDARAAPAAMPPLNARLVVLTPAWTRALDAVEMLRGAGPSPPLWGMDPGDGRVALLQSRGGGLLMEMPYARGYLAVKTAYAWVAEQNPPRAVWAPSRVVTPDTMYRTENIKLMFPLLQ